MNCKSYYVQRIKNEIIKICSARISNSGIFSLSCLYLVSIANNELYQQLSVPKNDRIRQPFFFWGGGELVSQGI